MSSIKNAIALLYGMLFLVVATQAQAPNWTINPSDYQYSMTITSFLNVDGNTLIKEQDEVAAFVNGEIRGTTNVIYAANADRYLAYLTVYANTDGEVVDFSIYDSNNDKVVVADTILTFKIDEQYGSVFQAFSIANPRLSNEANILNFFFTGVDSVSTTILENEIDIVLEYDQDLGELIPEYTLSDGANIYIDGIKQISAMDTLDFSIPIYYEVLSEDESVLKTYVVSVQQRQVSDEKFTSTNVITANYDGQNDYWIVQDVFLYNNYDFQIFDANGKILFESVGYNNDWDGTYNGKLLDIGNYYYTIQNKETSEVIKGSIMLLY